MGPVFPCGCMTLPLGLPLVCWSTDLGCANTAVEAQKTKAAVRATNLSDIRDLDRGHRNVSGPPDARIGGRGWMADRPNKTRAIEVPIHSTPPGFAAESPVCHGLTAGGSRI